MVEGYVYLLRSSTTGLYKIGMSVNPENRIKQVEAEIRGMGWELVAEIETTDQRELERVFHRAFDHKRAGRKEWFVLSRADVELFVALAQTTRPPVRPSPVMPNFRLGLVMEHLKRTRNALSATVYQEATSVHLDGSDPGTLLLLFPEDASFHLREGLKPRHLEALAQATQYVYGIRPVVRLAIDPEPPLGVPLRVAPDQATDIVRSPEEVMRMARDWMAS